MSKRVWCAISKTPEAFAALADEILKAPDPRVRSVLDAARASLADPSLAESQARAVVEALALAAQGSLMQRHSNAAAAEAFCESRLNNRGSGRALGALSAKIDTAALVERAALEA